MSLEPDECFDCGATMAYLKACPECPRTETTDIEKERDEARAEVTRLRNLHYNETVTMAESAALRAEVERLKRERIDQLRTELNAPPTKTQIIAGVAPLAIATLEVEVERLKARVDEEEKRAQEWMERSDQCWRREQNLKDANTTLRQEIVSLKDLHVQRLQEVVDRAFELLRDKVALQDKLARAEAVCEAAEHYTDTLGEHHHLRCGAYDQREDRCLCGATQLFKALDARRADV